MEPATPVVIRMFGALRTLRCERGFDPVTQIDVPAEGVRARDIAADLDLPVDFIEGVFVNHTVRGLDHRVMPGDRIAFVPPGTPGPHRYTLGLYRAGADDGCSDD